MMIRKISTYFVCFSSLFCMGLNAVVLTVNSNSDAAFATGGAGVGTTGDLRYALNYINQNPNTYQVVFALGAGSETITLQGMLPVLNLNTANNILIDGSNTLGSGTMIALSGANTQRGFFAQQGPIAIQNMNIRNTVAKGGNGGLTSGAGGLGAGGALFVNQAQVSLSNVNFSNNTATGGNGATQSGITGGGGGMGGNGGSSGAGGGLGGNGGADLTGTQPAGGGGIAPGGAGGTGAGAGQAGGGFVSSPGGTSANGTLGGINAGGGGSGNSSNNAGGGGGVAGSDGAVDTGGVGGFGGGGGGGGSAGVGGAGGFGGGGGAMGGAGGFGGGGAGGNAFGGNGGFGGGGGGSPTSPGVGGVGGGQGAAGGGGGAGLGGDIFVNSAAGGFLVVNGPMTTTSSNTIAGTGGGSGTDGAAAGDALFVTAGLPLVFSPPAFDVIVIEGSIGDDSANTLPGPGYTPGTSLGAAIIKDQNGELQLLGDNTYSGPTILDGGILTIDSDTSLGKDGVALEVTSDGTLKAADDFSSSRPINLGSVNLLFDSDVYDNTWNGVISGPGGMIKRGTGTLTLRGANTYTQGTLVSVGTLKGDTQSLQGFFENNSILEFNQDFNGFFNGSVFGNGIIEKTGSGTVGLVFDSPFYTGRTNLREGGLELEAVLGGDVFVYGGRFTDNGTVLGNITVQAGLLRGNGEAEGNVTIKNGGTITPTGTFRVGGYYVQEAGSTYRALFNRAGENSLIHVAQTATLNPGSKLVLAPLDGFKVNTLHTILTADRGRNGEYTDVTVEADYFSAVTLYDENNVYVYFKQDFSRIAERCNQDQIAVQLEQFGFDISTDVQNVLQEFSLLDLADVRRAMDQISGEQYTNVVLTTELSNRQFTRRIFDPLRQLIATNPCAPAVYCAYNQTYDVWSSISGGQSFFQGGRCASGFKISDFEYTIGVQTKYFRDLTFGCALTFERGNLSYDIGGSGKNCTVLGGVYALYRPKNFYVFGDINLGASSNRIKRSVNVGSLHFKPKATVNGLQSALYTEIGTDFGFNFVLLQPFFALEIGTCQLNNFSDSDSSGIYPFALRVSGKSFANASTRLGVHLSSAPLKSGWSMAMDFSWNYRVGSTSNSLQARFRDYGDSFVTKGVPMQRNALEATVMFNQNINKCWDIYLEGSGLGWNNSFSYSLTAGVLYTW